MIAGEGRAKKPVCFEFASKRQAYFYNSFISVVLLTAIVSRHSKLNGNHSVASDMYGAHGKSISSANGARYNSQGQARSEAERVAPG